MIGSRTRGGYAGFARGGPEGRRLGKRVGRANPRESIIATATEGPQAAASFEVDSSRCVASAYFGATRNAIGALQ